MITPRLSAPILLVEDNEGHRFLIREQLRAGGLANELVELPDGQAALDYLYRRGAYRSAARARRPGLILLDINMPKVDGFAVLEQVKRTPALQVIPIFMLTSTDDQREINRCYALGANSYIVKPIRSEQFQARMQALGTFLGIARFPG